MSEHPIYRSAFVKLPENLLLPDVQKYAPIQTSSRSNLQYLLRLNNNEPFLAFGNVGKGRIYLSSVPFDNAYSNFQNQPIFVVTILNMILQSANNEQIYYSLGQQEAMLSNVENSLVSEVFRLNLEDSDFEVIPQVKFKGNQLFISTFSALKNAGNYVLKNQNETVAKLSYNFDRRESNLQSYSQSELVEQLNRQHLQGFSVLENQFISLDDNLLIAGQGMAWWKWCLLFALLFLLTEVVILRFF